MNYNKISHLLSEVEENLWEIWAHFNLPSRFVAPYPENDFGSNTLGLSENMQLLWSVKMKSDYFEKDIL